MWWLINDIGCGVDLFQIRKTKAHATAADVQSGKSTWWEKSSNATADLLAKRGAALHPADHSLLTILIGYETRVAAVLKYIASDTFGLGRGTQPRDNDARRRSHQHTASVADRVRRRYL